MNNILLKSILILLFSFVVGKVGKFFINKDYYDIHIELAEDDIDDSIIYENIKFDDLINKIKHMIGGKDER